MNTKSALIVVTELIELYTQDIEDIEVKDWLSTAITSHIQTRTQYPELYVRKCVDLYFMGFSV